jgi:hypothetical protein
LSQQFGFSKSLPPLKVLGVGGKQGKGNGNKKKDTRKKRGRKSDFEV